VWERVSTFDGVNDELMPLMRMTSPRRMRSLQPEDVVLSQRLFRSWVLLCSDSSRSTTTTVRDRLTFEPRRPFTPQLAEHVVRRIFRHRHRRLRRHFGS
jgi:hypothetical protein